MSGLAGESPSVPFPCVPPPSSTYSPTGSVQHHVGPSRCAVLQPVWRELPHPAKREPPPRDTSAPLPNPPRSAGVLGFIGGPDLCVSAVCVFLASASPPSLCAHCRFDSGQPLVRVTPPPCLFSIPLFACTLYLPLPAPLPPTHTVAHEMASSGDVVPCVRPHLLPATADMDSSSPSTSLATCEVR